MLLRNALFSLATLCLFTAPAQAQTALVDYVGFGYEVGPALQDITDSAPGDELVVLTSVSTIDPVFGVAPGNEVTIVLDDLVSTGSFDASGTTVIAYVGGTLSMYEDPSNDADWGINPPNGTAPSSFVNGDLLFQGTFTSFTLFVTGDGIGAFEGNLDAVGGSALASVCADCAYSFAGVFTTAAGAQIPEGYAIQVDGTLEVDSSVDNETTSFGAVKGLYRN